MESDAGRAAFGPPGLRNADKMKRKVLLISLAMLSCCMLSHSQEHNSPQAGGNILAFRTNLLLPFLNAGIEVPLGNVFSFSSDLYYPWIGYDKSNENCLQAMLADIQFRWWFKHRVMDGYRGNTLIGPALSAGVYAGYYDFEYDGRGLQGELFGLYIDYGYSLPFAGHCILTFSIGAGITQLPYRTYKVYTGGGRLIRDNTFFDTIIQWTGPVHAGITLSIPVTK